MHRLNNQAVLMYPEGALSFIFNCSERGCDQPDRKGAADVN